LIRPPWPALDRERFPTLGTLLDERLQELEAQEVALAGDMRKGWGGAGNSLPWLVLVSVAPIVAPHLNEHFRPRPTVIIEILLLAAALLAGSYLVMHVIAPVLRAPRFLPAVQPEDGLREVLLSWAADDSMTDARANVALRKLIAEQRFDALDRARADMREMRSTDRWVAMCTATLLVILLVLGIGFFIYNALKHPAV